MREVVLRFSQDDLDAYGDLDRRVVEFPSSTRSRACDHRTGAMTRVGRNHFFGNQFVWRHLAEPTRTIWHERYKLAAVSRAGRRDFACMAEIERLIGSDTLKSIRDASEQLAAPFCDPDLVVYEVTAKPKWTFVEVKRRDTKDVLRPNQIESLALLESIVPESEALVVWLEREM